MSDVGCTHKHFYQLCIKRTKINLQKPTTKSRKWKQLKKTVTRNRMVNICSLILKKTEVGLGECLQSAY